MSSELGSADPTPAVALPVASGRLLSPVLLRAVVATSITLRLAFLLDPFELHGISDFHGLGQRMLEGALPYRDFTFEYPPLAAPVMVLEGLVPAVWSASALAALSFAAEGLWLRMVWHRPGALERHLLITLPLIPLASGGFDTLAMLAIGGALLVGSQGAPARAWSAAGGALVKLFPVTWFGTHVPWRSYLLPVVVMAAGLLAPLAVAPIDDTYLGFALNRGVHQESVAASVHTVSSWARGLEVTTAFRFRNEEIDGAGAIAAATFVLFGALALVIVLRVWRQRPPASAIDATLVTHALLLCVLCGGKVLSPQYVLIAVPTAVLLGGRRALLWAVIGALTILPFSSYSRGDAFMAMVAVRNAVLVAETLVVAWLVLRPGD